MTRKPPSISVLIDQAVPLPGTGAAAATGSASAGLVPADVTQAWKHLNTALGASVPAHVNGALASARRLRGLGG